MNRHYQYEENGYLLSIDQGIERMNELSGRLTAGDGDINKNIARLKRALELIDTVIIGAGAGLSTSAGFVYDGELFHTYFPDFIKSYGIRDMYTGSFYEYPSKEIFWAWCSRMIYVNRYLPAPKRVYEQLLDLVKDKDYFVITTNVDHQFQKAGFAKERLFYTQGDYGLFQDETGEVKKTYDNEEWVMQAMATQGFVLNEEGFYVMPEDREVAMAIPHELLPVSEEGSALKPNLRGDDSFVEDEGWHEASARYARFLKQHENKPVLFMELGVGGNTPVIIKFPFWQMTYDNPQAVFACLNYSEALAPVEIAERSIIIAGDIGEILELLKLQQ